MTTPNSSVSTDKDHFEPETDRALLNTEIEFKKHLIYEFIRNVCTCPPVPLDMKQVRDTYVTVLIEKEGFGDVFVVSGTSMVLCDQFVPMEKAEYSKDSADLRRSRLQDAEAAVKRVVKKLFEKQKKESLEKPDYECPCEECWKNKRKNKCWLGRDFGTIQELVMLTGLGPQKTEE